MTAELTGLCQDHSFETAENLCRRCGFEYCELCLVYPFGARRPLCKECAMVAGGVRHQGARPEMAKRDVRRRVKAWDERRKRTTAGAAGEGDPILNDPLAPTDEDLERVPVPTPVASDGAAIAAELNDVFNNDPFDNGALDNNSFDNNSFDNNSPSTAASPGGVPGGSDAGEQPADGVAPPIDWSQPFG
ncbi:MAG: hypothetical protein RIB98_17350 [Acidimicrobiales bacterium]